MTRSEAIAWFENWLLDYYDIDDIPRELTAELAGIALAALRQQETVTNRNGLNEPLTLDELRKMDGEPVWIKLFDTGEEFWVLRNEWVDTRNPEPKILFHMRWYSHADYGKTWLAYRQKPEEDGNA